MSYDWMPFACLMTGGEIPNKPFVTRLIELGIVSVVSSSFVLGYWISKQDNKIDAVAAEVKVVQRNLDDHDTRNRQYREEHARYEAIEDAKWDQRIQRMEACFIYRNCENVPRQR